MTEANDSQAAPAHQGAQGARPGVRLYLALEFLVLFFVGPMLHVVGIWRWHPMFLLIAIGVPAVLWLAIKLRIARELVSFAGVAREMPRLLGLFVAMAILITVAAIFMLPAEGRFWFPRNHPLIYLAFLVAYPIFSVFPQELVYRTFIFRRYERLFARRATMILASGIAFAFAHIVFHNAAAPLLTLPGGLLFAYRYQKTRSLTLVTIEHALYGIVAFSVGLHRFFYHGPGL
jgi:membrane protease YdiL (CAAX protease family)